MSLVTEASAPLHRVLIAVPCGEQVAAGFAQDLANLVGYTTFVQPRWAVDLFFCKGTYLPRARNTLVNEALNRQATHILWLDADMRFPKDTLLHLLAHGRSIVGANYPTRQPPILPTAHDMHGDYLFGTAEQLIDAKACGFGCLLTDTGVFREMEKPWFAVGYNAGQDDYASEDTYFCLKAKQLEHHILIDPVLSEKVRHVGSLDFTMEHARMTRDAAKAHQET